MYHWTVSEWNGLPMERDEAISLRLYNFLKQAKKYQTDIIAVRKSLLYIHNLNLLSNEDNVQSEQCDNSISSTLTMREYVQLFCRLLDESASMPPDIAPLYYELMVAIHHVDEELRKLTSLLIIFRSICRSTSKQAMSQRQKIFTRLEIYMESCDDILNRITHLLDEVHIPEPRSSYLLYSP